MAGQREMHDPDYRGELDGGLVVRWSTPRDTEPIAELSSFVFRRSADEQPNRPVEAWIRDLMSGRHPHMDPGSYVVVEEPACSSPALGSEGSCKLASPLRDVAEVFGECLVPALV